VLEVQDGNPCVVKTALGSVTADQVVMATHSPKGVFGVQASMEPKREYALAVRLKKELPTPAIYWDINKAGQPKYSIRTCRNNKGSYLLVLHEQHKVGHMEEDFTFPDEIEAYLRSNFDVDEILYAWSAQKYSSVDKLPYIGLSPIKRNIYIATGFSADGLVYGTLSAMIIKDAILGIENPWARLYDPFRMPALSSIPKFLKHNYEVLSDIIADFVSSQTTEIKLVERGKGKVIKINGNHLAVYKDREGGVYALSAICPHMGCTVHWNGFEKSWDCPCHGSRFSKEGELLEGPAYRGLKIHYIKKG
jgi:Rieske Fe-S protein